MSRASSSPNRYSIALHDTLSQETHRNGKDLTTHFVVVKNTPFLINISSKDPTVNFRKTKITATLAYDCEPRREVTLIRSSPLEYVTHLSSNGELITIEARIHVLTSQNENSLFRVCLKFNDEDLVTEPLKVISKADNLKKSSKDKSSPVNKKKRTSSDAFGDTLQRIEQQQQEQKNLIDMLYQQNQLLMTQLQQQQSTPTSAPPSPQHSSSQTSIPSPQLPISSPPSDDTDALSTEHNLHECTSALQRFLNYYKNLSSDERPRKIRVLTQLVSSVDRDTMTCFAREYLDTHSGVPSSPVTEAPLAFSPMDSIFGDDSAIQQLVPISSPEHDGYWSSSPLSSPSYLSSPSSPTLDDTDNDTTDIFSELFSTPTTGNCIFTF
jgi:hypothetical protein